MTSLGPGAAVLAFDVGGTDTKSALIDETGTVRDLRRTATARGADAAGAVVADVARLVRELRERHPGADVAGVGVVVPGLVDEAAGVGVFSANLGWRDAPIAALLQDAIDLPVGFGHDVRAAARAELEIGAARGLRDVVIVPIGTGIAGTIVTDGRILVSGGYAGELGHTLADPHGDPCPCGAVGCLETVASAGAIVRRYAERSGTRLPGARDVLAAARMGDRVADGVWNEAIDALAQQIARLAGVLAPEAIVIGGGLAQAGPLLFGPLAERVDALLSFHRRPRLIPAAVGEDAGLLGSALRAREVLS
ncbi:MULTISPECIES: ROK family protein [Microbacterium]|uniref:ROK family protein n=1 Tax=Microbacterium TaxID=33882 RepID=UPI001E288F55|nr:ROK family protein [Microbacterium nymphoidis]MCD2499430.1 ROK family protein [Microbacterium nymphoidis]